MELRIRPKLENKYRYGIIITKRPDCTHKLVSSKVQSRFQRVDAGQIEFSLNWHGNVTDATSNEV